MPDSGRISLAERLGFRRRVPVRFLATINDPVAGDAEAARALLRGEIRHERGRFVLRGADWSMPGGSDAFRSHVHGFAWLRDLGLALTMDRGGDFVQPVIKGWLAANDTPDGEAWRPDRIGARLAFWAFYAPYILSSRDGAYRGAVLGHYARAATYAEKNMARAPQGLPRIVAAAGLVVAGLMLERGDRRLVKAENLLDGALSAFIMPHGLPASRRPADLLEVMRWMHMLRAAYEARSLDWPEAQQVQDGLVRAGIRAARLGDGRLAALHGSPVMSAAHIDNVLAWPGMAARGIGAGATSGLQRLESGRAIVLVDAGPPPDADLNAVAHAGALAFEMSDGEERIITNVGGSPSDARLDQVVRTTAAHSTITIDDRNQSHVPETGALGAGVDEVEVSRQESEEGQWLDMCHDGYRRRFGLTHHRRLFLAAGGTDLRGEDVLSGAGRKAKSAHPFALRFHLTPGTDVAPTADGKGAVLKTTKGRMWQFKLSGGTLVVDDSLWIGEDGGLNRSRQLAVTGESAPGDTVLRWRFNKVR